MTDYYMNTGSSGKMMIRDTGTTVEFWLNSQNSTTWSDHIPWSYTINGGTTSATYSYPANGGWRRLGYWNITYSQTVTFHLGSTGTGGFGGPTTFNQFLNRGTIPPAPNAVTFPVIGATSLHVNFSGNGDGGTSPVNWQIAYGLNADMSGVTIANGYDLIISGLLAGTTYYFWARGQNSHGDGPWSARSSVVTHRVPDAPSAPVVVPTSQFSLDISFTVNGDGGAPILQTSIGWGTNPVTPEHSMADDSPVSLTGLQAGTLYYVWASARNNVGWGPWSEPTPMRTIAGARILTVEVSINGPIWTEAVPWVKDGGVWKVARPWGRTAGVWGKTR